MQATNKIILGTVQFGLDYGINNAAGKPSIEEIIKILDTAKEQGIQILDTAEAYGNAQEIIGEYHRNASSKFEVVTKFSPVRNDLLGNLKAQVLQNLQTLETESLYGYMFHSFRDFENYFEEYKNDIRELKENGSIKKFGVSVYSNAEMEAVIGCEDVNLIQLPFNVLDNETQRMELIRRAKSRGIEIHTRSVFLQGLFFKDLLQLPEKLHPLIPHLKHILSVAHKYQISLHEMALNYALGQEAIDCVVIGLDTLDQLKQNLGVLKNKISEACMVEIAAIQVQEQELLNPTNWNS